MYNYSQDELDAKISTFMDRKTHQFPQLNKELYYVEHATSRKPVEKHADTTRSRVIQPQTPRLHYA